MDFIWYRRSSSQPSAACWPDAFSVNSCQRVRPSRRAVPADNSWQAVPAGQFAAGTVSADNFALEIQQAGFLLRINIAGILSAAPIWSLSQTRDKPTLFEQTAAQLNIRHKPIRPYTPRHNGKVERSHREDQRRFMKPILSILSMTLRKQLSSYLYHSNSRPMRSLSWLSLLENFLLSLSKIIDNLTMLHFQSN